MIHLMPWPDQMHGMASHVLHRCNQIVLWQCRIPVQWSCQSLSRLWLQGITTRCAWATTARFGLLETMPSGSLGLGRRPPPMSPNQSCYQPSQVGCMHDSMGVVHSTNPELSRKPSGGQHEAFGLMAGDCLKMVHGSSGLPQQLTCPPTAEVSIVLQLIAEARVCGVSQHWGLVAWCSMRQWKNCA